MNGNKSVRNLDTDASRSSRTDDTSSAPPPDERIEEVFARLRTAYAVREAQGIHPAQILEEISLTEDFATATRLQSGKVRQG